MKEMTQFLVDCFLYNYQTNIQWIEVLVDNQNKVSEKATQVINHTLNAHQIWNNRIQPQSPLLGVMEIHPWHELLAINELNYQQTQWILENRSLTEKITYQTTKGQIFA
ncbi:MAG: damage-inducible protein DinB, partial [Bacteroidia bacterium]|nr:damage-inducible protein DinB [Bacteroidia bacterium]